MLKAVYNIFGIHLGNVETWSNNMLIRKLVCARKRRGIEDCSDLQKLRKSFRQGS